jgi:hypothetical protein
VSKFIELLDKATSVETVIKALDSGDIFTGFCCGVSCMTRSFFVTLYNIFRAKRL